MAVDGGLELDAEAVVAVRSRNRIGDRASGDDRLGDASDGEPTCDDELVAVTGNAAGIERDLRGPVPVEELGGEEVSFEVLLLHLEALDRDAPRQLRLPGGVQDRLELTEAAAEGADGMPDRELGGRMNRI